MWSGACTGGHLSRAPSLCSHTTTASRPPHHFFLATCRFPLVACHRPLAASPHRSGLVQHLAAACRDACLGCAVLSLSGVRRFLSSFLMTLFSNNLPVPAVERLWDLAWTVGPRRAALAGALAFFEFYQDFLMQCRSTEQAMQVGHSTPTLRAARHGRVAGCRVRVSLPVATSRRLQEVATRIEATRTLEDHKPLLMLAVRHMARVSDVEVAALR